MPCARNKTDGRIVPVGDSFRWKEHTDWEPYASAPVVKAPPKKKKKQA